jgi:hypothetical protein
MTLKRNLLSGETNGKGQRSRKYKTERKQTWEAGDRDWERKNVEKVN